MQNTLTKNFTETQTQSQSGFLRSNNNLFLYVEKRLNQIFLDSKKINVVKGRKETEHVYVGKIGSGKYEYRVLLKK